MTTSEAPWVIRLANAVDSWFGEPLPDDVAERAAIHVFDTIACAAGAWGSPTIAGVRAAISGSGPEAATVWFGGEKASIGDAALVNGTAARYLDANDVFMGSGPGGHPSDNIPVAVAAAEAMGADGKRALAAVAIGYELVARLRSLIFRPSLHGPDWHEVSVSGPVTAAMAGLLMGADTDQLANAIAIGASGGYSLKEIRRGQISQLKAAANATVARGGVMAATLAMHGLTGPPEVFEGRTGLLATVGLDCSENVISALCEAPSWVIRDVSIKAFPAFGTSQAAICAAVDVRRALGEAGPSEIESVLIRLPDTAWTREYLTLRERHAPRTRGTADHSMQFLVAAALVDGDITQETYEQERWLDENVGALMARIEVRADPALDQPEATAFPASVEVRLTGGRVEESSIMETPGSPDNPFGWEHVKDKFSRLDRTGSSEGQVGEIAAACRALIDGALLDGLAGAVGR